MALPSCYPRPLRSTEVTGPATLLENHKLSELSRPDSRTSAFLPAPAEARSHYPEQKQGFKPLFLNLSPSGSGHSSPAQAPSDVQSTGDSHAPRQPHATREAVSPEGSTQAQPLDAAQDRSPESAAEELLWRRKAGLLHRSLPPKVAWAPSAKDGSYSRAVVSPPAASRPSQRWQSLPTQSSTSSEPETPSPQGMAQLHISESGLRLTPPPSLQDEEDDEVFVTPSQAPFSPPPPSRPLPELSSCTSASGTQEFPPPPPPQEGHGAAGDKSPRLPEEASVR